MRPNVRLWAATSFATSVFLGLGSAMADGLPGMRGHDHTGITLVSASSTSARRKSATPRTASLPVLIV
ncbi:MAG: hypothetical protein WAN05_32365 [Roseiarcus sp.]